ncbi:sensor histidine kinase [Desulfurispira natronophila]|uniref:histidine kinase n=1 Tax=Desulfurispira natronophila TaxID=682562 RepID=A0A7W7Y3Q3_9BACT|nr:HAMP domain-containing sensor histidine kinase [Desulfurispira natronophila]MBB5021515.1 signal transduction histidine kinase [Desulfurispira natronophila]
MKTSLSPAQVELERSVDELKKENEALQIAVRQQSKLASVGMLSAAIAHQWLQPLSALTVAAQELNCMCDMETDHSPCTRECAQRLMEYLRFMTETMESFREFSSAYQFRADFCVFEAVSFVVKLLKGSLIQRKIQVDMDIPRPLIWNGYANEFKHVVMILLSNAMDACAESGKPERHICISVQCCRDSICLACCDNGVGIPEQLLPDRLFDLFVSTKGDRGTGLGLNLARRIVHERMFGAISAENSSDGGACISVRFPRVLPQAAGGCAAS